MHKISTTRLVFLLLLFSFTTTAYAATPKWPLKRQVDLSSGFGDYRQKRFHAGLDIRTGGKPGDELHSPVDGYVWRIKMSYEGYGKGLYVKGDDGYIYVFGHLSDFARRIDRVVKHEQVAAKRYYVDLYFPPDSLPVKAGEVIAFTGQTGSGAPHLHFERRTSDNMPVNPLLHGYKIGDKTRPTFTRVGFRLTDDHSLLPEGTREAFYGVTREKAGNYTLDTMLYFNSPFGFEVECFDQMRPGGMKQAVYSLTLNIDGEPYYEVLFDTLDFATGRAVDLVYDYRQAVDGDKRVRRLYYQAGNTYRGARSLTDPSGVFGLDPTTAIGRHEAKVVARDCYGNTSELKFDFLWGPPGYVYTRDSTVKPNDTTFVFHFSPVKGYKKLDIDSVMVLVNRGIEWGPVEGYTMKRYDDGKFSIEAAGFGVMLATARLGLMTKSGAFIIDNLFSGVDRAAVKKPRMQYEIIEDGMLVTITCDNLRASDFYLRLYRDGQMLAALKPTRLITKQMYAFFIPPKPEYAKIDYLDIALDPEYPTNPNFGWDVGIFVAGLREDEELTIDSMLVLHTGRENFYKPSFVAIEKQVVELRFTKKVNSDFYRVKPDAFITASDFDLSYTFDSTAYLPEKTGLCWLDEKDNKWVWLDDNAGDGTMLTASSQGGGPFTAVIDDRPPTISDLSPHEGWNYRNSRPTIRFLLDDEISGIRDDRNISISIDGEWLIPEYEPETKICRSRPLEDLSEGFHKLDIVVTDRAGNMTEQSVTFNVDKNR